MTTSDAISTASPARGSGPSGAVAGPVAFRPRATRLFRFFRARRGARRATRNVDGTFDSLPRYRTIIATDIVGFGRREEYVQNHVRERMYKIIERAFVDSGMGWPVDGWIEDRGDGALIAISSDIPIQRVVDPLVRHLTAELRRHNKVSSEPAKINLRMAVHAGYVGRDQHGLTGEAIVRLFRLLDAQSFREAVAEARPTLGLVVSQDIYESVIRSGLGLMNPDDYTKVAVVNKETVADAWILLNRAY